MAEVISLELQQKIHNWRMRAADNSLTLEEMKEAIKFLRADRQAAAAASAGSTRKRAIAAIPSAESMLDDLDKL